MVNGEGNGNPLQYPCLENPMDRGARQAAVHGVAKSQTQLSRFTFTFRMVKSSFKISGVYKEYSAAAAAKWLQSCPTLCDPIDSSPLGSSVPGFLQARILEWVAISLFQENLKCKTSLSQDSHQLTCCKKLALIFFFSSFLQHQLHFQQQLQLSQKQIRCLFMLLVLLLSRFSRV